MLSDKEFAEIKELNFELAVNTAYSKGFADGYEVGIEKANNKYQGILEKHIKGE